MNAKQSFNDIPKAEIIKELYLSINQFKSIGLTETCKFLGEQLNYFNDIEKYSMPQYNNKNSIKYIFAKSLFDCGKYLRCADVLLKGRDISLFLDECKEFEVVFLYFYCIYLNSLKVEKIKTFENYGKKDVTTFKNETNLLRNEVYVPLKQYLLKFEEKLINPLLLYLFGITSRRIGKIDDSLKYLQKSVINKPSLWCSWKEMIEIVKMEFKNFNSFEKLEFHNFFKKENKQCNFMHVFMYNFFKLEISVELGKDRFFIEPYKFLKHFYKENPYLDSLLGAYQYNNENFIDCQKTFADLIKKYPNRIDNLHYYSHCLFRLKDTTNLSVLAKNLFESHKFSFETCICVGNFYAMKYEHAKAIENFQRALKVNPKYDLAWTLIGHEYCEMNNTSTAVHCYRKAIEINPNDYRSWYGIGQAYEILEMYQFSIYYYSKAVSLEVGSVSAWIALAQCYELTKNFEDSIKAYEMAYRVHGYSLRALTKLAELCSKTGRPSQSIIYHKKLLEVIEKAESKKKEGGQPRDGIMLKNEMVIKEKAITQLYPEKIDEKNPFIERIEEKDIFKKRENKFFLLTSQDEKESVNVQVLKAKTLMVLIGHYNGINDPDTTHYYVEKLKKVSRHDEISSDLQAIIFKLIKAVQ